MGAGYAFFPSNKLTFDFPTLKVVSESRVVWDTYMPILIFLGLSVLDLGPMYATDRRQTSNRQTSDSIIALCPRLLGAGHNNRYSTAIRPCMSSLLPHPGGLTTAFRFRWPSSLSPVGKLSHDSPIKGARSVDRYASHYHAMYSMFSALSVSFARSLAAPSSNNSLGGRASTRVFTPRRPNRRTARMDKIERERERER